jgi:hypothetical protein
MVALANTPATAAQARRMKAEYKSAACDDVAAAVDREMKLRQRCEALEGAMLEVKTYPEPPEHHGIESWRHMVREMQAKASKSLNASSEDKPHVDEVCPACALVQENLGPDMKCWDCRNVKPHVDEGSSNGRT